MGKIVVGILAHVDAGKTTLSEGMLYTSGAIRTMGRVDNRDAFLDTYALERERGITIFSKQAVFPLGTTQVTLLDTPGHVDFSPEMERTLQVLDYAILVISGADGVQGHTRTLWNLLRRYEIPTFVFVNKMDQEGTDAEVLLQELKNVLEEGCVDFSTKRDAHFYEETAVCSEDALEEFLETGRLKKETLQELFLERQLFPCFFGSALRLEGVKEFLEQMQELIKVPAYPETFGAKVFKIARDEAGNRLTYLKITGGSLKVKAVIEGQKVNQIRIYSGEKYEAVNEVEAGSICAVTGLSDTYPGEGFGAEQGTYLPVLEPVLNYQVIPTEGDDPILLLPKLRELEEEEPQLHIVWEEALQEIHVQLMGEVQLEVLKTLIYERFGAEVEFGQGNILYKETIQNTVEGVGHFEPLRHYAEVHLLLEPGEPGSGVQCMSVCSEDLLDRNWQRLILTHLMETEHRGVLTGAPITDIRITLVSGKAHLKHTEGGDFRQAVYRAVRQGLKQADSVLLEPYYEYRLELPSENVGRAMTDIERMHGTFGLPQTEADRTILTGMAPVSTMRDYQKEVHAYTRGNGTLQCTLKGYAPCHNTEEVLAATGYDSERDTLHPTGSVFCAHGAGFLVPWYEVKEYMHLPSIMQEKPSDSPEEKQTAYRVSKETDAWIDTEEVDRIIAQSVGANKKQKTLPKKKVPEYYKSTSKPKKQEVREEYLLVDGYNVIFAWEDLKDLAQVSIDGARGKLLDVLCDYQGMKKCNLIVVFDAYRVQGHKTEISTYHNIHVVFTKEAETADQYIEKFAHENGKKYNVTVATSDGLEQIIIRGQGCRLLSARELKDEIERTKKTLFEEHPQESKKLSLSLKDML
ncbi:MAG: translation factor GTPase family protein [Lachnospiraceae bacterium]|nr:translation factor GTPase family protein [Lachnospiraceae bacterium]